jgi:hypothetical protein
MNLKQTVNVAGIAALVLVWCPTLGSAHSLAACEQDVREFCGSNHDCRWDGYRGCLGHGHPGGSVPPAPDPQNNWSNDPGRVDQLNEGGPKLKAQ